MERCGRTQRVPYLSIMICHAPRHVSIYSLPRDYDPPWPRDR